MLSFYYTYGWNFERKNVDSFIEFTPLFIAIEHEMEFSEMQGRDIEVFKLWCMWRFPNQYPRTEFRWRTWRVSDICTLFFQQVSKLIITPE